MRPYHPPSSLHAALLLRGSDAGSIVHHYLVRSAKSEHVYISSLKPALLAQFRPKKKCKWVGGSSRELARNEFPKLLPLQLASYVWASGSNWTSCAALK